MKVRRWTVAGRLATTDWPLGCIQITIEIRKALARDALYLCFSVWNLHAVRTRNMKVQGSWTRMKLRTEQCRASSDPLAMFLTGASEMSGVKNGAQLLIRPTMMRCGVAIKWRWSFVATAHSKAACGLRTA